MTTQPCQAVCCCVSVVVCLFVCLFVCLLSGSLTAALRREVFGPEQNSAVLLGGRVCCQSAAGSPGESAAQVGVCACVSGCVCVCVCVLSEHFFLSDCLSVTTGCGCLLTSLLTFRRSAASEFSPSTAVTSPGRRYAGHVFIVRIRPESLLLLFNCRKRLYPFIYFKSF